MNQRTAKMLNRRASLRGAVSPELAMTQWRHVAKRLWYATPRKNRAALRRRIQAIIGDSTDAKVQLV